MPGRRLERGKDTQHTAVRTGVSCLRKPSPATFEKHVSSGSPARGAAKQFSTVRRKAARDAGIDPSSTKQQVSPRFVIRAIASLAIQPALNGLS